MYTVLVLNIDNKENPMAVSIGDGFKGFIGPPGARPQISRGGFRLHASGIGITTEPVDGCLNTEPTALAGLVDRVRIFHDIPGHGFPAEVRVTDDAVIATDHIFVDESPFTRLTVDAPNLLAANRAFAAAMKSAVVSQ
ncbi:hypothetical protein IPG36_06260 [bacterium]|nr:MAG: hypothetical protein IPG36_06260 [bacterium]